MVLQVIERICRKALQWSTEGAIVTYMNKPTKTIAAISLSAIMVIVGVAMIDRGLDKATEFECHGEITVVQHGDTIWDIVSENCTGHTGHASYETVRLNGNTTNLQVGQTITLP